jgi:hypothetical protein
MLHLMSRKSCKPCLDRARSPIGSAALLLSGLFALQAGSAGVPRVAVIQRLLPDGAPPLG